MWAHKSLTNWDRKVRHASVEPFAVDAIILTGVRRNGVPIAAYYESEVAAADPAEVLGRPLAGRIETIPDKDASTLQ